jgi:hypothetical protein
MIIRALTVCLFITCGLVACTQVPTEPPTDPAALVPDEGDPDEAAVLAPIEAGIAPTPAMLEAALLGDPEAMAAAVAPLGACHASSTCTGYGSCSGWSAQTLCNTQCGPGVCFCKPWLDPGCQEDEPRGRDYYESYRVCFNAAGQSCTEWKQNITLFCGCY